MKPIFLELCCGTGSVSDEFAKLGYECYGVDIRNLGYKHNFIEADLFDWKIPEWLKPDGMWASPTCSEFSIIKQYTCRNPYDERIGLDLVYRCFDIIQTLKPKFWALENVPGLGKFLPPPREIVRYGKKKGRKEAYLWGDFPSLGMFNVSIEHVKVNQILGFTWETRKERARIPYALAQKFAQVVTCETKDRNCLL